MPVAYIDLPAGLPPERKRRLMRDVASSLHDAYPVPDNRVYLREVSTDHASIDGDVDTVMRPICTFVVPPGLPIEGKRALVGQVTTAIVRACDLARSEVPLPSGKVVSTAWVLSFFSEYPLDRAALDDLMAFENPMVVEAMPEHA